jgi:hypothetical protein
MEETMATHRIRRRARSVLLITSIAIIGVGIFALVATSEEGSKPGPVPQREGGIAASPAAANGVAGTDTEQTVAAQVAVPTGVTCPTAWSYFDNPVMHYGLCIPPAWGFSDFRGPDPLDRIPTVQLENLHLLGNAFPWRPGTMPFDAVRQGVSDIELDVLPPDTQAVDECEPTTKKVLGVLSVLTCEQSYDEAGMPALTGTLRAIKVVVPLRTPPADEPGARLLIIARTRTSASLGEVSTLWQIVQNVHPY